MKTPKIRFKGYTEDWEQRKLKDFGQATGGTSIESEFSDDGVYKVISIGSYSENSVYTDQGIRAIDSEKTRKRILNKGDLTMILNDKTASGNIIGRVLNIEESGVYVYNQRTERIEIDSSKYDSTYLYQMLNAPLIREKIIKQSQGNTQIYVNWPVIEMTEYLVPKIEEQRKVGTYFQQLDHLITLHQRKCKQIKKLKKFMLQNMFPKNGEYIPTIRFEGFTNDWEQRKLGDITSRVQGNDGRMDIPTLTISAANGWMNQEDRFSGNIAGKEQSNYTLLHKGELSYNHGNSKLAKYGTVFALRIYEEALVPRVYHSFKVDNGNADFIEYYFATKIPDRELGKLITSGARMDGLLNIGYDSFMGIEITVPKLEEQDKISEYFRVLDTLITLHQRKCDELQNLKKYMLQNMFI